MDENKSNKGLYFVPMNGCPLKMMEMKNEWGLLFKKRIRNACQLHYTCLSVPLRLIATNVLVPFSDIHIAYLSHKVTKKHKKTLGLVRNVKAKGKCLNLRLRVSICYRLLFVAICNVTPYFAGSIWMNVQERGDVLQIK